MAVEYQDGIHGVIVRIGHKHPKLNIIVLCTVFLVLCFMAAFRGMDITNDTEAYYRTYQKIAYSGFAGETRMERGYVALNLLLSRVFQDNLVGFHVLLFITAVFSYLALEQWIRKTCGNLWDMYSRVLFSLESKFHVSYSSVSSGWLYFVGIDGMGGFERMETVYCVHLFGYCCDAFS